MGVMPVSVSSPSDPSGTSVPPASPMAAGVSPKTERVAPVVVRVVWFALVVPGLLVGSALDGRSAPVVVVATALWWVTWGAGLVAVLVWHPAGLVWLRCAAPAASAATIWAVSNASDEPLSFRFFGIAIATLAAVIVASPEVGHLCVNGPAYPNERRFLLRPSAALAVGPLLVSGALVGAGAVVGPLLLAAKQWILGALFTVLGAAFIRVLGKALYGQARRFVVFVPAGFVLHDEFVLRDPDRKSVV